MHVQEQVQLKNLNTLNLNAMASHYVQINQPSDVIDALAFAEQQHLNVLILSGGSNVLLPQYIQALVLHLGTLREVSSQPVELRWKTHP